MSRMITYRDHESRTPGTMRCDCDAVIEIYDHHDVDCERCGRSYNSASQLLADRSQWGQETGETAADYDQGVADGDAYHDYGGVLGADGQVYSDADPGL